MSILSRLGVALTAYDGDGLVGHVRHNLVSAGQQRRRHSEPQHPGGLGINDKLELALLHDRHVRGICTFEYTAGINTDLTKRIRDAGTRTIQMRSSYSPNVPIPPSSFEERGTYPSERAFPTASTP